MRRRQPKPEVTEKPRVPVRERIIAAADKCFYLMGINTTKIPLIALEAKTNSPCVIKEFHSHEDLVIDYLRRKGKLHGDCWTEFANESPGNPAAQLRGWIELASHETSSTPEPCPFAKAAIELGVQRSHPGRRIIRKYKEAQLARVVELCRAADFHEPELLAKKLMLLVDGAYVSALTFGSEGSQEQLIEAAEELMALHSGPAKKPPTNDRG